MVTSFCDFCWLVVVVVSRLEFEPPKFLLSMAHRGERFSITVTVPARSPMTHRCREVFNHSNSSNCPSLGWIVIFAPTVTAANIRNSVV